jgi:hypothetical protein
MGAHGLLGVCACTRRVVSVWFSDGHIVCTWAQDERPADLHIVRSIPAMSECPNFLS